MGFKVDIKSNQNSYKWIDYLILTLCCSLFFAPFYNFDGFSQVGWLVENHHLQLIALLLILLAVAKGSFNKQCFGFNLVDLFLLLYCIYIIINTSLSHPIAFGFTKFQTLLTLAVLYVALRFWIVSLTKKQRPAYTELALLFFFMSLLAHSGMAVLQLTGHLEANDPNFRMSGGFMLVSHLAFYMGLSLPLAVGCYLFYKGRSFRVVLLRYSCLFTIILTAFLLPLTQNRSSWIMALAGLVFMMGIRYYPKYAPTLKKIMRKRLLVFGILSSLLILLSIGGYWLYSFKQGSSDGRILVWKILTDKAMQTPFLGQGYNEVEFKYGKWLIDWFGQNRGSGQEQMLADQVRVSYNEFLEILVESGIIGLTLFLGILVALVRVSGPTKKVASNAPWHTAIVALLACGMFSYPFTVPVIKVLFFFCIAIAASQAQNHLFLFRLSPSFGVVLNTVILIIAIPIARHIHLQSNIYADLDFGRELYTIHDYQDALPYYEKSTVMLQNDLIVQQEYAETLYQLRQHQQSIEALKPIEKTAPSVPIYLMLGNNYKALGNYPKAEQAYMKAFHIAPSRFYPLYLIARMYFEAGDTEKSRSLAQRILSKKVKVDSQAIREIRKEMELILQKTAHESKV